MSEAAPLLVSSAIISPETIFFLFVSFSIAVVSESAHSLQILKIHSPPPKKKSPRGGGAPLTAPPP